MTGIQYVVNEGGDTTAVIIDLKKHKTLWEDFHDALIVEKRGSDERDSLESVREKLKKAGKLR